MLNKLWTKVKQVFNLFHFLWKDAINIKNPLLWIKTANYIFLFLVSNRSFNVDEPSHYKYQILRQK